MGHPAPFGEVYNIGLAGNGETEFAQMSQDTLTGMNDAMFRKQSASQGRWLSPDPSGLGAVDWTSPQTWNRYAYVLNNPLRYTDPSGLVLCDYGSSDNGGWDFEDADDDADCLGGGGIPATVQETVVVNGDDGSVTETILNSFPTIEQFSDNPTTAANNGFTWAWNFTKSFFTFAGGPGNKPTCAGQTLRAIGNELTGGFLGSQAAETSLKAASVYQAGAALNYAANQTNTLGGIGLICPQCSSVFRGMMSQAEVLGELSEAVPLVETSVAAGNSIPEVSAQARNGECSAAFPVF
ncbi:MAG TPA: RHS repeat-associated core domain-containing protein [Candidatus Binatia bacterium]|nr:RHS repeat-associated core domain-containing protein [Candidatus Binatia bacterium]